MAMAHGTGAVEGPVGRPGRPTFGLRLSFTVAIV